MVDIFASGNKSEFARLVGISPQTLNEILGARQSTPSYQTIANIARALPQLRMSWLITGEGEMLELIGKYTFEKAAEDNAVVEGEKDWSYLTGVIAKWRELRHMGQAEAAQLSDLPLNTFELIESGKRGPSPDALVKISKGLGLPLENMFTGDIEHVLPKGVLDTGVSPNLRILTVQVESDGEENIPLVSTRAAAGYAAGGFMEKEFVRKLPSFRLPDPTYRNATFRCFQVSGQSMESTLFDRDWVICRYMEDWAKDIRDTYLHVVVTEETVLVKRISNQLNERGELVLHSDNPAFPIQFMDAADVREVWLVVARLTRQLINPRYDVNKELARHSADIGEILQRLEQAGL